MKMSRNITCAQKLCNLCNYAIFKFNVIKVCAKFQLNSLTRVVHVLPTKNDNSIMFLCKIMKSLATQII